MYKIVWAENADFQYRKTLVFWTEHNGSSAYSEKIIQEVENREKLLADYPLAGHLHKDKDVRKITFLKYFSLVYKVLDKEIFIVAFWDARRNPKELKL